MFETRTAIITGAASGIGLETTERFLKDPKYKRIYAVDKNPQRSESGVNTIELDLREGSQVGTFVHDVLERDGKIDVLVNGAGILNVGRLETYSDQEGNPTPFYNDLVETNYNAPLRLMNLVLPSMRENHSGVVVNITSTKEFVPDPYHVPYSDLKAKLTRETEKAHIQEKKNGVRVVALQPGNTKTNIDPGRWTPESNPEEMVDVQTLHDWWRKTFGNDPAMVANKIYRIAEGEINSARVLVGIDAHLASVLHHVPYWEQMFSLGYNTALTIARVSLAIQNRGQ